MSILYLYRNSDTLLEDPYQVWVPAAMDTLAELCAYISEAIPPVGDPLGKGYRFLYSLQGKPLWRVRECLDAGTIIISPGPGFLARRAVATADALAAARDVTPADVRRVRRSSGGLPPSPSPPALQPELSARGVAVRAGGGEAAAAAGVGAAAVSGGAGADVLMNGTVPRERMSIHLSVSPYSGAYERGAGRGVCGSDEAAASVTACGPGAAMGHPYEVYRQQQQQPSVRPGEVGVTSVAPAPGLTPEAQRLFGPDTGSDEGRRRPSTRSVPPPTELRAQGKAPTLAAASSYERPVYGVEGFSRDRGGATTMGRPLPVAGERLEVGSRSPAQTLGEVLVGGALLPLPPPPAYTSVTALLSDGGDGSDDSSSLLTGLRTYAARKWKGFSELSALPPSDVLGEDLVQEKVQMHLKSLHWPLRVVVSGPPRSGVSSTASLALRTAIHGSARDGPFYNHLHLVLDGDLLFSDAAKASPSGRLDLTFAFQLVVRAVLDAIAVQRPALRSKGLLLAQLWDKIMTTNTPTPPDFTAFPQVTAAVGQPVVRQWDLFARRVFPILQGARREPAGAPVDGRLRDVAMALIFHALPGEIASSLRFSGVVYALDGLATLAGSEQRRVERAHGDLGAILRAIWADPHAHVIAAWPAAVPLQSIYLAPPCAAAPTLQIRTVGLIPSPASSVFARGYDGPPLPQMVECRGRPHSVEVFLGCPGYLAPLAALARPLVGGPLPTTAFSAYSQSRRREKAAEPFHLRIDDAEVGGMLDELERLAAAVR